MIQEYKGSCHCEKVKYKVKLNLEKTITCNCSMCHRAGSILTLVPESDFQLEAGENKLSDYQFNKKTIHHLFCKNCGIKSFGWGRGSKGEKVYAVNVRCVKGVDIEQLTPQRVNGKDF